MTKRNEKSIDFHEFLTLRRDRERRAIRVNRLNRNRLDFNRLCHFRELRKIKINNLKIVTIMKNRLKCNDKNLLKNEIKREKRVKNSEKLVQLIRIKDVKRFIDQILKHHFRQQSKRHELRSTIQNNDAKHSRNDYSRVNQ
jgi:hypothetical protein